MFYLVNSPWFLRKLYSKCTWKIDDKEKNIYLSFDDGPHPSITLFVLEELKKYNATATFFCIGKNVAAYPQIYKRLIDEGHAVANHTHHHLNGWKNSNEIYLDDIVLAQKYIDSKLFRPPYGRIRFSQLKRLISHAFGFKTIMWSVLSGDFDKGITKEKCLQNVICNTTGGSIIVFHDSDKAFERMQYALPATLKYFTEKGFKFKKINIDVL